MHWSRSNLNKSTANYLNVDDEQERRVWHRHQRSNPIPHATVRADIVHAEKVVPDICSRQPERHHIKQRKQVHIKWWGVRVRVRGEGGNDKSIPDEEKKCKIRLYIWRSKSNGTSPRGTLT